jgi:hypothetical protein
VRCDAVLLFEWFETFGRAMLPSFSRSKVPRRELEWGCLTLKIKALQPSTKSGTYLGTHCHCPRYESSTTLL